MDLPKKVEIIEVGPRDGIQNEKKFIPTDKKIEFVNAINQTGIKRMEATSFVSPKHVPQMADAKEVWQGMAKESGIQYMTLIPNQKGYERALEIGVRDLSLVSAVSNTFNLKNVRMTKDESLVQMRSIVEDAKSRGLFVRYSVSTSFWCPFDGEVKATDTIDFVTQLDQFGVDEIVLCDTIGRANPSQVYALFSKVLDLSTHAMISAHFHDTYGMALSNSMAALQAGISRFDTAIGGLGGCPFAPGAAGNGSTEDLVFMLHEMGIETGINFQKLLHCVELIKPWTERELTGHIYKIDAVKERTI
jgi:hydroxymethylglutaryl-CoA lyase